MANKLLLREAAKSLGLSEHFLRKEAKSGRVPHLRVGNRYMFDIEQVEEFLSTKTMQNVNLDTNNVFSKIRSIK